MSYENLEPHGRLTIAGAEFAWDFYRRASQLNNDEYGNAVISPTLIQLQLVLMTNMATGETRKQLFRAMHLLDDDDAEGLMMWMLWAIDYFMREVALSYGTKPRSALIVSRAGTPEYTHQIMQWLNHYRTRKCFHLVPTLKGAEKKFNDIIRRLTGAYPRDSLLDLDVFSAGAFDDDPKAVIINMLIYQLFLPSCGCPLDVSEKAEAFWRTPTNNELVQGETLGKVRIIRLFKKFEHLEDEQCELIGVDLYPANLTIYFMLPKDMFGADGTQLDVNQALAKLEEKLDGRALHNYIQKMLPQRTIRTTEILLSIPCFSLKVDSDLERPLKNMNLEVLFDPKNKDWTNLFKDMNPDGGDFYLSKVKQITTVQMLPTSTASNFYMKIRAKHLSIPDNYAGRQLILNRPFLFFIYDHFSRVFVLFGRCLNPCDKQKPKAA